MQTDNNKTSSKNNEITTENKEKLIPAEEKFFCVLFTSGFTMCLAIIILIILGVIAGHFTMAYFITGICNSIRSNDFISWQTYTGCWLQQGGRLTVEHVTFGRYIVNILFLLFQYVAFIITNILIIISFFFVIAILIAFTCAILILLLVPVVAPILCCIFMLVPIKSPTPA